ncbi:MAG: hypothetical protein PHW64_01990 [Sulfuricurvum sp.]|nr:hypothetical protein [Sulfuricurvum sp.]
MYLDAKALGLLFSPFILAGILWSFIDIFVSPIGELFEPVQQQTPPIMESKRDNYLYLGLQKVPHENVLKKIRLREENRFWISERLYTPSDIPPMNGPKVSLGLLPPPALLQYSEGNITQPTASWSIQMVMPEQNMAIINNKILRVGQRIDGVKLLQVENNRVLIQTTKGDQWVKLFH